METTTCKCGNFGCSKRISLGLAPFCQVSTPARRDDGLYGSFAAAAAASPVGKARCVQSSVLTGKPAMFEALAK